MNKTSKLKLYLPTDADDATQEDFNANFRTLEAYVTSLAQIASADTPSAMDVTTSHKQLSFGKVVRNGPAFSLSGGGLKVASAGFAIVSINVNLHSLGSDNRVSADVCKNGATFYSYSTELSYGWEATIAQTTRLIPVAANDILTVKVWNDTESKGSLNAPASWMTAWFFKNLNF